MTFDDVNIETGRLSIRQLTTLDLDDIYAIISDDEVMRFLPDERMAKGQYKKILEWLIGCYGRNTPDRIIKLTLGITLKNTKELAGWCGVGPLEFERHKIELFYGLARRFWGRGIATEAARAVLDFGFSELGLKEIVAVVSPANLASRRVIEKLGMIYVKQVAGLPAEYVNYENDLYYSLARHDYLEKKKLKID